MFGLEVFLEIATNCKDELIMNKALKRFIEYFLRPFKGKVTSCKVDKVGLWMLCAEKLTKHLDLSNRKYIGYSVLFEEIKGRMKSINILDPSESTFTVLAKESGFRKMISLPKNASLWKLRQVINAEFKLNNTNFEMYATEKRSSTDMEFEEDFSVLYLEVPKDPACVCVVVTETKDPHPHFVAIE